jgi:hypothetical protein
MPYSIKKNAGDCDGYAVVNSDTGDVKGCHPTEEAAKKQLAALYANVPDAKGYEPVVFNTPPTFSP